VIYLPSKGVDHPYKKSAVESSAGPNVLEANLRIAYKHKRYYAIGKVILRPMSEVSQAQKGVVHLWFNILKK